MTKRATHWENTLAIHIFHKGLVTRISELQMCKKAKILICEKNTPAKPQNNEPIKGVWGL